ncbi:hypothetical protein BS78_09G015400 [Paspalum vaginatum]|nr:hypothetical protein BS78_09G015400 [Paspalum vaginatum]
MHVPCNKYAVRDPCWVIVSSPYLPPRRLRCRDMKLARPLTTATEAATLLTVHQVQQNRWRSPCSRRRRDTMRLVTHSYRRSHPTKLSNHRSRQRPMQSLADVLDRHPTPLVTGHATLGLPRELHAGARGVVARS